MIINKATEEEIDKFLKDAQIPSWHRGYRYLKDLIIYSIVHPDTTVKEGCEYFAKQYNTNYGHIYRALKAVAKEAKIDGKQTIVPRELINMCISSISYASLHGDND